MKTETRHLQQHKSAVKLSKRSDGTKAISGYAAVYYSPADLGTEYKIADDMVERIRPGAFNRAIRERHDARFLVDHDPTCLLARVSSGTLHLTVDAKGLHYQAAFDDRDFDHQRILPKLDRGDLNGSSFAFRATAITWEEADDVAIRWVEDLDLLDVSVVSYPAYQATTADVRSGDAVETLRNELSTWRQSKSDWRLKHHEMTKMRIADDEKLASLRKPAKDWRQKWLRLQKERLAWKS